MKTEGQFSELVPTFHKAVNGKTGISFANAVIDFALKTAFVTPTISLLYKSDTEQILFITDHPLNDTGFIFYENFWGKSCFLVGSKKQIKADIGRYSLNKLT